MPGDAFAHRVNGREQAGFVTAGGGRHQFQLCGRFDEANLVEQIDAIFAADPVQAAGGQPSCKSRLVGRDAAVVEAGGLERARDGPECIGRHLVAEAGDDIDPAMFEFGQVGAVGGTPTAVLDAPRRAVPEQRIAVRARMSEDVRHPRAFGGDTPQLECRHHEAGLRSVTGQYGHIGCIVAAGRIEQSPVIAEVVDVDRQLRDEPVELLPRENLLRAFAVQ